MTRTPRDYRPVDIYCLADSHGERRWEIGQFVYDTGEDDPILPTGQSPMWVFGDPHNRVSRMRGIRRSRAWVRDDGSYVGDEDMVSDSAALDSAHLRWRLRCELCGLTFVRRAEALSAVLDKLAAAGIEAIDLATLADTVGRSSS